MTTLNATFKNSALVQAQSALKLNQSQLRSIGLGLAVSVVPLCAVMFLVHVLDWHSATAATSRALALSALTAAGLGSVVVYLNRNSQRDVSISCALSFAVAGFLIGLM